MIKESITIKASEVHSKPIRWLWPKQIAKGKLTILTGDPGLGKSQISNFIAATVSRGGKWPIDGSSAEKGSVILLNAEDDAGDTIKPRLQALNADLENIQLMLGISVDSDPRGFRLDKDLEELRSAIDEMQNPQLVIIDPISAYLGGVDSYKDSEIRSILIPLSHIAEEFDISVIAVSHLNKNSDKKAIHRISGSIGLVASARTAFSVVQDPENAENRLMLPVKNNISKDKEGFSFTIRSVTLDSGIETSKVLFGDQYVQKSVDEVLSSNTGNQRTSLTKDAEEFLLDVLKDGPAPAKEILELAKEMGIPNKPVRNAAENLKVNKSREGYGKKGKSMWRLS